MTIQTFPTTLTGQTAAFAVSDPKNVTFAGNRFEVRDGVDYVAPPAQSQDEIDAEAARSYAKLKALVAMTPAQVQAWVAANVTNLAQAQDAIATLAVAVSVLARRL
jgi:hypothetical protein